MPKNITDSAADILERRRLNVMIIKSDHRTSRLSYQEAWDVARSFLADARQHREVGRELSGKTNTASFAPNVFDQARKNLNNALRYRRLALAIGKNSW